MKTKTADKYKHQPIYSATFEKLKEFCFPGGLRAHFATHIASKAIEEYLEKHKGE